MIWAVTHGWEGWIRTSEMTESKSVSLNLLLTSQYQITISDPLRAILDREFVDGNLGQEFILHRFFITYILYHKFFKKSIKFLNVGEGRGIRTLDPVIKSHMLCQLGYTLIF